jgi:hypothetical protein
MTQLADHCKEASTSYEAQIYNLRLGRPEGEWCERNRNREGPCVRKSPSTFTRNNSKVGSNFVFAKRRGVGASLTQDSNCCSYARADRRFHLAETPIVVHNRARSVGKLSATLIFHSFVAMVRLMAFNLERVEPLNPSRAGGKE